MPKTDWRDLASTPCWAEAATNSELEALLHELNEAIQEEESMPITPVSCSDNVRRMAEEVIAKALATRLPDDYADQLDDVVSVILDAIVEPSTSWTFAHVLGFSVRQWMEKKERELKAAVDLNAGFLRISSQMVLHWPSQQNNGPVLYHHYDGTWWLETLRGDIWRHCKSGPYADRTEAVRAWLDTVAAQAPSTAPPSEVQAATPSSAGGST